MGGLETTEACEYDEEEEEQCEMRNISRLARNIFAVNTKTIPIGNAERLFRRTVMQTLSRVVLWIEAAADCNFSQEEDSP